MSQSLSFTGSNSVFHWKLEARWMERVQQVMCEGPAEPENPVCPEEALPKGGGRPAFALPGEHTHASSILQQPCLPSRVEPRALVSGNWERLRVIGLVPRGKWGWQKISASQEALSYIHLHGNHTELMWWGILISFFSDSYVTFSLGILRSPETRVLGVM